MEPVYKIASVTDLEALLEMMKEFYACEHLAFKEISARNALTELLKNRNYGTACLIFAGNQIAGYFIITYCFSLEFQGRFALIDELFLTENYRNKGLGKSSLLFIEDLCKKAGIRVLRLEVEKQNHRAFSLYVKSGFVVHDRYLLSKWLE